MRSSDGFARTDLGAIYLWEQVQEQAKRLKLEIKCEGPHFQVYPTQEFMGKRTTSPGGKLTAGIATLEGLCAFLAGIEAIIHREEMIQSLIRVPEKVVEIDPVVQRVRELEKNPEPNCVGNMGLAGVYTCLQEVFDILYWDGDAKAYDPDNEWDSAADFLQTIAEVFIRRGIDPQAQSPK